MDNKHKIITSIIILVLLVILIISLPGLLNSKEKVCGTFDSDIDCTNKIVDYADNLSTPKECEIIQDEKLITRCKSEVIYNHALNYSCDLLSNEEDQKLCQIYYEDSLPLELGDLNE